jgi:ABC-2 type transport system permease protein
MTSAMTRNQVVSLILSVVICLILVLCGFPPATNFLTQVTDSPWLVHTISAFSVYTHFEYFSKGVLDSRDVIYFFSVIGFSLFTTGVIIRSHRAG